MNYPNPRSTNTSYLKQEFKDSQEYLSFELGQAVRQLPPVYTHIVAASLTSLVAGGIGWATFSRVDEVAQAEGQIVPDHTVQPLQASIGGRIRGIYVKEGQTVRKGMSLMTVESGASENEVRQQQLEVEKRRLEIDKQKAEAQKQSKEIEKQASEVNKQQAAIIAEQEDAARLQSSLAAARDTLQNAQAQKSDAQQIYGDTAERLTKAKDRQQRLNWLAKQGAVGRLDAIDADDRALDIQNQVTTARTQITRLDDTIADARDKLVSLQNQAAIQTQKINQVQQTYQQARQSYAQAQQEFKQAEKNTQQAQQSYQQATAQQQPSTIVAPETGTVYNLKVTQGQGALQPNQEVLSILPDGVGVKLKVNISNKDIGFIKPGMTVKVKIDTFQFQEFGTVNGTVEYIAPNSVIEKSDDKVGPLFQATIRLAKDSINVRGEEVKLKPGMTVRAEVVTHQRTVISLLMEPMLKQLSEAFSVR